MDKYTYTNWNVVTETITRKRLFDCSPPMLSRILVRWSWKPTKKQPIFDRNLPRGRSLEMQIRMPVVQMPKLGWTRRQTHTSQFLWCYLLNLWFPLDQSKYFDLHPEATVGAWQDPSKEASDPQTSQTCQSKLLCRYQGTPQVGYYAVPSMQLQSSSHMPYVVERFL